MTLRSPIGTRVNLVSKGKVRIELMVRGGRECGWYSIDVG